MEHVPDTGASGCTFYPHSHLKDIILVGSKVPGYKPKLGLVARICTKNIVPL